MASLLTNMRSFPQKHHGKLVGLLDSMFGGSTSLFALIYAVAFVNGHLTDHEELQNFGGFMLMFGIISVTVNVLGAIFLRVHPPFEVCEDQGHPPIEAESQESPIPENIDGATELKSPAAVNGNNVTGRGSINSTNSSSDQSDSTSEKRQLVGVPLTNSNGENMSSQQKLPLKEMFKYYVSVICTINFNLLAFGLAFVNLTGLVFVNNITIILKSANLEQYSSLMTVLIPLISIPARAVIGPLSDHFKNRLPRLVLVLGAYVLTVVSSGLCAIWGDTLAGLVLVGCGIGIATGVTWTLVPAILGEMYGLNMLGGLWGTCTLLLGLSGILIQEVFGAIYDYLAEPKGSLFCYGIHCSRYTLILLTIVNFIGVILTAILYKRTHRTK